MPKPICVPSQARVRPDGSVAIGLLKFDATEAGYIRAAAGNLLSGDSVSPVGISAMGGARWLLEQGSRGSTTLVITRHGISRHLNAGQVMLAFNLATKL